MKYPQKYEGPGNSTAYCFDTVMLYIIKTIHRWTKGYILPFPKKGVRSRISLELPKYNPYIHSSRDILCSTTKSRKPKIENILKKNQNAFHRNRSTTSQILIIRRTLESIRAKKPRGNNIICRLHPSLWLHTQKKDGANNTRLRLTQRNCCSHNDCI